MVLGSYSLGDLYQKFANRQDIPGGGGPSHEAIVQALNRCNAYLLVRTPKGSRNEWHFRHKAN